MVVTVKIGSKRRNYKKYGLLSAAAVVAALQSVATAANYTWSSTSNTTWATANSADWTPAFTANVAADTFAFNTDPGSGQSVSLGQSLLFTSITFNAGGWIITEPSAFTLTGAAASTITAATGTSTLSAILAGSATSVTAAVSSGATLILGSVNTYTGTTILNNTGTVQLGSGGKLGASGLTFAAAGLFDLNGQNQSVAALTSAAGGTVTNTAVGTSTLTLTGATTQTFNGVLQNGSGSEILALTVNGSAPQIFTGTNTYTGATSIIAGKITLAGPAGAIQGGTVDVGSGTTLAIDSSTDTSTVSFTRLANVTLDNSAMTLLGRASNNTNDAASGALNVNSGYSTFTATAGATSGVATMNFNSLSRPANGGGIRFNLPTRTAVTFTTAPTFIGNTVADPGHTDQPILPYALFGTSGTYNDNFATYDANGIRALTAAELTSTSVLTASANVKDTANIVASAPVTINSLTFATNVSNLSGNTTLTISSGGILVAQNAFVGTTISVATLNFGSVEGMIFTDGNGLIISSQITGTSGLTRSNLGFLTLSGANTGLTGTITLNGGGVSTSATQGNGGVLTVSNDNNLGNTTTESGIVTVGTTALEITGNFSSARTITTSGLGNFQLVTDAGTATLSGLISGNSGLQKLGAGSLVLTQAETYTGATNINLREGFSLTNGASTNVMAGGTLVLGAGGTILNSSSVTVGVTGTLLIDSSASAVGTTARTNAITLSTSGDMTLNGNSSNNTTDSFGALTIGGFAGESLLTVNPGVGQTSTLQFASLTRTPPGNVTGTGGTVNFIGPNFGQAAGANVARVAFTSAPGLQNSGASATQILPWAVVTDTATGLSSIATYDSTLGSIRGLTTNVAADYKVTGVLGTSPVTAGNLLITSGSPAMVTGASTPGSLTLQGNGATLSGVSGTTVKIGNGNTTIPVVSQGAGNVIGGMDSLSFGGTGANEAIIWVSGDLTINSPIVNAGTSTGITKSGSGNLILNSTGNTFSTNNTNHVGTIKIEDGTLTFSAASNLGNTANAIDIWHGTLHLAGNTSSTVVVPQVINIGINSAVNDATAVMISVDAGMTLSTSTLVLNEGTHIPEGFTKTGAGTLLLTGVEAANNTGQSYLAQGTFALGATTGVGATFMWNSATMTASPGTTIHYDSSTDTATAVKRQSVLTFSAANLTVTGNSANTTSDTNNGQALNLLTGGSSITVTPGASQTSTLTLGSLVRSAGSTIVFNGSNLGKATTASTTISQVIFSTAPGLTGGALGGTTAKILPYALAVDSGLGVTTFATYDVTTVGFNAGIRALTSAEMTAADATPTAGVNWLVSASDTAATLAINSLTMSANSATVTDAGTLTVTSGGILSKGTGTSMGGGTVAFGAAEGVVHVLAGDDLTINSAVTGTGGLTKADGGALTLTSTSNTYTGTNTVNAGTLSVSADTNLGNAANTIVLNMGGTLIATTGFTSSRAIQVNPGGGTGINVASGQTLTLNGNITNTLPSGLAPATALGTLAFSGGGTLALNGTVAPVITVTSGSTLSGTGNMTGGVAVQSGGHIAPGNGAANIATLHSVSLTLASGSILDYDFGTALSNHTFVAGSSDSIAVTGGASSLTFTPGNDTVTLNLASGAANITGSGSYELLSYTNPSAVSGFTGGDGTTTGSIFLGTSLTSIPGATYTLVNDPTDQGIFLDFTVVGGGVPAGSGVWKNGSADGKWTTNTAANNNWSGGIPNGVDQVATFDDTAIGGAGTVDLNGDKTVGGLLLNTASAGYTLGLPGTTNTLTLQTSTGNASIGVGGAASHTINALVNLASNTNVSFIAGASLNLVGAVSGTGSLNLSGTGTLKLSAAAGNTYTGTNVSGGTLLVSNTSGSATGASNVVVTGGTLGGHGIISGTVNASSGTQTIFPSATLSSTSTGTLTMGGLTTGSGTTLQFNLVTPGNALNSTVSNSDAIMVTGANGLTLNGGTVNLTNHSTGAASLGFYKVIAYSGTIGGTGLSSLTLPATVANVEYTFDTTHDAGFVDIHRGFAGDVDDSGFVDINDLAILAAHWQQTGGWAQGNFLNDPLVDINDLAILAANWQTGITSFGEAADSLSGTSESFQQAVAGIVFGGVSSVPEPTSLALLGLGAAGLLIRRRNRR